MATEHSIAFTAREFEMHKAGVIQGTGAGMKAVASQLRAALVQSVETAHKQVEASKEKDEVAESSLDAFKVWVEGFQPWIDAIMKDAESNIQRSNTRVQEIGPAPRNLRKRVVSAILAARKELSKG